MNATSSLVAGFLPQSLVDWPGKVSAVVFLPGCNLRCPTCHNADLAFGGGTDRLHPWHEIFTFGLTSSPLRRGMLDGVTISGGEPTANSIKFTLIAESLRMFGFRVNLHTNGMNPEVVESGFARDLVQHVCVDVKGPWSRYPELTGRPDIRPSEFRDNLEKIFALAKSQPAKFYFRTTVVPSLSEADLEEIRSYLPDGHVLHLQEYREPEVMVKAAA